MNGLAESSHVVPIIPGTRRARAPYFASAEVRQDCWWRRSTTTMWSEVAWGQLLQAQLHGNLRVREPGPDPKKSAARGLRFPGSRIDPGSVLAGRLGIGGLDVHQLRLALIDELEGDAAEHH